MKIIIQSRDTQHIGTLEATDDCTHHMVWRKAHLELLRIKYELEGTAWEISNVEFVKDEICWHVVCQPEGTSRQTKTLPPPSWQDYANVIHLTY